MPTRRLNAELSHLDDENRVRGSGEPRAIVDRLSPRHARSAFARPILRSAARIILLCSAIGACATPRAQFTADQAEKAYPAGYPHVRAFADSPVLGSLAAAPAKLEAQNEFVFLALSGGGADGAFGAGILSGWSDARHRPEFTVVSGTSTGALMAPFAFLGPEYDHVLKEIYTAGHAEQFVKAANVSNVIFGAGLISAGSAHSIIAHFIDRPLLDKIAREHRKGRRLYVVTTNLDAQRPVLWDMGAIASSDRADAETVFGQVLTASASFPGVFSPVLINVEADGHRFAEMHVDGETTDPMFVAPERILKSLKATTSAAAHKSIYMLVNTKLEASFEVTENTPLQVPSRAVFTLTKTERRNSVLAAYEFARRNNFKFNLAYLPRDIPDKGSVEFDGGYMRSLFEYGYQLGRSGLAWHSSPPQ
jgi:predicted acylesterase/phospholipase RssA